MQASLKKALNSVSVWRLPRNLLRGGLPEKQVLATLAVHLLLVLLVKQLLAATETFLVYGCLVLKAPVLVLVNVPGGAGGAGAANTLEIKL
jgi:hypothetical protein